MKISPRTMTVLGFLIPLCIFCGILYIAIEYKSIYVFLGSLLPLVHGVSRGRAHFFRSNLRDVGSAPSQNTQAFFSGLTGCYFLMILPFACVVLYAVWALWISQLF